MIKRLSLGMLECLQASISGGRVYVTGPSDPNFENSGRF